MAEEAIKTATEAPKAEDVKVEVEKKTIGDVINEKQKEESVPLAAFLDLKKDNKQMDKDIKALKKLIEDGGTKGEVIDTVDSLATEYNLDPKFLNKLANSIRKDVEKEADEKLSSKLKPLEAKDREDKIDKAFTKHFKDAMAEMPEYADIVNEDVIKSLSLEPKNQNKTFAQLIEDTYGKALPGKRTLESTKPGGGRAPEDIDFDRASKDPKYFKQVMENPETKRKYNEQLMERIKDSI